jgi:hypothetical protein
MGVSLGHEVNKCSYRSARRHVVNVDLPAGAADFAALFVGSAVGIVAAWCSGLGADESAPILRECDR